MSGGNCPLEIGIESWEADAEKKIPWGQVAVDLEGLKQYLIDVKRFWVTYFNVMEGNRWSLRPAIIGRGFVWMGSEKQLEIGLDSLKAYIRSSTHGLGT